MIADWLLLWQIVFAFIVEDFIEWNVHRLLHTVPWMWEFHKLHHSIEKMDWIGAFRAHWGEIFIHRIAGFIPLIVLGIDGRALLIIAIMGIVIKEVSHSNLNLDWGPLRYVFNSPRYHAWHHDVKMYGKGGQNFAINLTVWDWLFKTNYWPEDAEQPEKFGFMGMKKFPRNVFSRLLHPFLKIGK